VYARPGDSPRNRRIASHRQEQFEPLTQAVHRSHVPVRHSQAGLIVTTVPLWQVRRVIYPRRGGRPRCPGPDFRDGSGRASLTQLDAGYPECGESQEWWTGAAARIGRAGDDQTFRPVMRTSNERTDRRGFRGSVSRSGAGCDVGVRFRFAVGAGRAPRRAARFPRDVPARMRRNG
jgi:hypothetical protein